MFFYSDRSVTGEWCLPQIPRIWEMFLCSWFFRENFIYVIRLLYILFLSSLNLKKEGTKEHTLRDPLVRKDSAVPFLREKAGTIKGHFEKKRNKKAKNPSIHARWSALLHGCDSPFLPKDTCVCAK